MPFIQGRNEQALVHAATAFAKHSRRHATLAVTSSIGPGALNMVTGAALATVNRLPVLLLPGDTYATRHQGPVLQQAAAPPRGGRDRQRPRSAPVCRFFDRITRPEQLLTALPAAMRVLTDPVDAGAVVISLPQDIQSHAYDWPAGFLRRAGLGHPAAQPDPRRGCRRAGPAGRRGQAADHRGRRRHILRGHRRARAPRRDRRHPGAGDIRREVRRPAVDAGGRSAASGWKEPRPPTPWPARPTWC